ncbi:MAG: hypothetical protein QGI18_00985, partial [Candidatus Marinimicrobia bacterium]|nr:hypothetical protein [Candidatus Neomarinimicrobiota bacterium]
MRVKWLQHLSTCNTNDIERYLADQLIGNYRGISGINILKHNTALNKFQTMNVFYTKAIKNWRALGITWEVVSIESIKDDIIYDNTLLTDPNNNTFPFFSLGNQQRYIPIFFKDLPVTINPSSIPLRNRNIITQMNQALWVLRCNRLGSVSLTENSFCYRIKGELKPINKLSFKIIYKDVIDKREIRRVWESKWNEILRYYTLDINDEEWEQIWEGIHDNLLPFDTQSVIWKMIHLNFYCGYKERVMNYGEGICKLCGLVEQESHHIILNCHVMKECFRIFTNIIMQLSDTELSNDEMAFGLVPDNFLDTKTRLRNLLTFVI